MGRRLVCASLVMALFVLAACGEDEGIDGGGDTVSEVAVAAPDGGGDTADEPVTVVVTPGEGILAGSAEVRIGDAAAAVSDLLGPPAATLTAPDGRTILRYDAPSLAISMTGGATPVVESVTVTGSCLLAQEGDPLSSDELTEDVAGDIFGAPLVEPFSGAHVHGDAGIVVSWDEGQITRISIIEPVSL